MLTREQYEETRGRIDAFEQWRGSRTCIDPSEIPEELDVTNSERSAVEVYEFMTNPPAHYFLYVQPEGMPPASIAPRDVRYRGITREGSSGLATTWTGEKLGDVQFGRTFRSSFGDTRVSIRVYAINGKTYAGTFYKSAGDYARVKMCKG